MGDARKKENPGFNVAMTKLYSDNCGSNAKLFEWGKRGDNKCPRCGNDNENVKHIVLCRHAEATKERTEQIGKWAKDMVKKHTVQPVRKAIEESIRRWLTGDGYQGRWRSQLSIVNEAIEEQWRIGWYNFLMGMWSKKWKEAQTQILLRNGSRRSASKWIVEMIKRIWKVPWAMWLHRNKMVHSGRGTRKADTVVETEV